MLLCSSNVVAFTGYIWYMTKNNATCKNLCDADKTTCLTFMVCLWICAESVLRHSLSNTPYFLPTAPQFSERAAFSWQKVLQSLDCARYKMVYYVAATKVQCTWWEISSARAPHFQMLPCFQMLLWCLCCILFDIIVHNYYSNIFI